MRITIGERALLIDDEDAAKLLALALTVSAGYAQIRGSHKRGGKRQAVHRIILGAQDGQHCDHINGDRLDNRRSNLRVCTHAQNMRNRRPRQATASGYKGVQRDSNRGTWRATIRMEGRVHMAGRSSDPALAAKKYDRLARELHGEFAKPNFPCLCPLPRMCPDCAAPPKEELPSAKARKGA